MGMPLKMWTSGSHFLKTKKTRMSTAFEFSETGHALCDMHLIHEMSLNAF